MSRTGYQGKIERPVGYADLLIETQAPHVGLRFIGKAEKFDGCEILWVKGPSVLVEAKVAIPSLGELMRQLRLYQTAFAGRIVVVSPDDTHASILAEQGIVFLKYTAR